MKATSHKLAQSGDMMGKTERNENEAVKKEKRDLRRAASQDVQEHCRRSPALRNNYDPEETEKRQQDSWRLDGRRTYDIRYMWTGRSVTRARRSWCAGGGPTIWVNTYTKGVEGYWGGDKVT